MAAPDLLSPASDARFAPGVTVSFAPGVTVSFAPGVTVSFDWADVAGAASYTSQIDNSDSFSSPLTLDLTLAASQHTASGLPATRMWWRVRANNSAGAPGTWSQARRFELKN